MLTKISPQEAHKKYMDGSARLIDIRSPEEFAQMSIAGSLLAPLPVVTLQHFQASEAQELIFLCRSGNRTESASNTLQKLHTHTYALDGGIIAWQKAGLPVRESKAFALPLERQIFIAAGSMVLMGVMGSFVWPPALFLAGFVGAGLVFSGISGFCGLGLVLAKMPWNRT